jgi:hypothetical protein
MRALLVAAIASLVAACAAAPAPRAYWDNPGGTASDFAMANPHCGAAASRATPTPRPDQREGGVVAPDNSVDRPPRPFVSAVAGRAYFDCMAKEGWRPVR